MNADQRALTEAYALIGTLRGLLGCEPRNVHDVSMEQHSREIMAAVGRNRTQEQAIIAVVDFYFCCGGHDREDKWARWKDDPSSLKMNLDPSWLFGMLYMLSDSCSADLRERAVEKVLRILA